MTRFLPKRSNSVFGFIFSFLSPVDGGVNGLGPGYVGPGGFGYDGGLGGLGYSIVGGSG